jgi:threonyl-tRNA synthetase
MEQGKRTKEELGERIESNNSNRKIGGQWEMTKNPAYIQHRAAIFEELWAKEQERIKALEKPDISITLPDGTVKHGKAFETTPFNIAKEISQSLVKECVAAKIVYTKRIGSGAANYVNPDAEEDHKSSLSDVYDMSHKFEGDCSLELIKFDSPIGKEVFWHSSAHVLGQSLENTYGVHLTNGPPLELGFFYDFYMGDKGVSQESFKDIEKSVKDSIKKNTPFRRLVLSKDQALELFKFNPFKVQFIQNKIPEDAQTSVYACGTLIDLCPGPHVPSTGTIKAMKLTKCSATNWLGDIRNDTLQRVYGVAFPSKEQLDEHIRIQEEIAKRDHRIVGEA